MKGFILGAVVAAAVCGRAQAGVNAWGFTPGMSRSAVEAGTRTLNLGIAKWFGGTLIVQGQDNPYHSYSFNFCNDRLYEVSQSYATNFDQMANLVDYSIRTYGQPMFVSASGGMANEGFVRPINLYWKLDETSFMRLMQLANSYSVIYEWVNNCEKVPR